MKERDKKEFKATIKELYGIEGEEQHNRNLEIMCDLFFQDFRWTEWTVENFINEYVNKEENLQKFIDAGCQIL